ncbi:unnamed protein product [Vicia faba]|uniref:Reverse transcriptase zinc-binding domain-containing protein n=1 Tax=Vicia faba TaxID=3906 RepID=A0AAV1AWW5_VICFA|nr:unnamed protein product [Vicia faba]
MGEKSQALANNVYKVKVRNNFSLLEATNILSIPLSWGLPEDKLTWEAKKNSLYFVKSAYHKLRTKRSEERLGPSHQMFQGLQRHFRVALVHNKIKNIIWRIEKNFIPVKANLLKKGNKAPSECPLCHNCLKTTEHMFFECNIPKLKIKRAWCSGGGGRGNGSSSTFCSWHGVTCGGGGRGNGRVVSLNVTGLRGGELASSIGELSELRVLSIPENIFFGEIPVSLMNLRGLEVLELQGFVIPLSDGIGVVVDASVFHESFLASGIAKLLLGNVLKEGTPISVNPLVIWAWAGLLINAINSIPAGELDGGRISFALWGRKLTMQGKQHIESSSKVNNIKHRDETPPDVRVRKLKDQLIQAKVYLSLQAVRNIPHLTRELRLRVKEVSRTIGEASKDSDLPRNANERMKAIEQSLMKARQIQDDCATSVKKLRAMLHSSEDQLRVHKKQTLFLTQLTAKTLPKGLHCLPLRLTTEYYNLNSSQQQFPNQEKLEDPGLYHYAIFSNNILATAVVVNSTAAHAKDSSKHVFHIVTDRLNYAAMRMWFLANPPGKAAVRVTVQFLSS